MCPAAELRPVFARRSRAGRRPFRPCEWPSSTGHPPVGHERTRISCASRGAGCSAIRGPPWHRLPPAQIRWARDGRRMARRTSGYSRAAAPRVRVPTTCTLAAFPAGRRPVPAAPWQLIAGTAGRYIAQAVRYVTLTGSPPPRLIVPGRCRRRRRSPPRAEPAWPRPARRPTLSGAPIRRRDPPGMHHRAGTLTSPQLSASALMGTAARSG
jgi:hypothetical protein